MKSPLVSITSAFYNTGPMLLDMIKSVLCQTYPNWELILLDDGSSDDSLALAKAVRDSRVHIFSNGNNLGRGASLNKLTTLCKGVYIARMDSDDMSRPRRIERQVALIESMPELDAVSTGICYLDSNDDPIGHWIASPDHEQICANPTRSIGLVHGALLGKKTWFEKQHYNENIPYAVDYNMLLNAYKTSRFGNVPEPLYYYRFSHSFSLKKQFIARHQSAGFIFEHFWRNGHHGKAVLNWGIQYGKFAATALMCARGNHDKYMQRRFIQLSDNQRKEYCEELNKIKAFEMPVSHSETPLS